MALLCAIASQAQTGYKVYTLTENCTITLSPSKDTYAVNDEVTVTITPDEGAIFNPNTGFEIYVECSEEEYNENIANAPGFNGFKARRKVGPRRAFTSNFEYRLEIYTPDWDYDYSKLEEQADGSYTCTFPMPPRNVEIEATCTLAATTYGITVTPTDNGTTSVSAASAVAGSDVTITATPADGYEVAEVNVLERDGAYEDIIGYTSVDATQFTFTMPANPVRVEVTYQVAGTGITLSNNADNGLLIAEHNGQIVSKVTLAGRKLYKDGSWNTLCLPFDVTISDSPLNGDGVDVRTLNDASFDSSNGTLTLNFTATVTEMEAGKPYLIKWDNTGADLTESDLVFTGVTIDKTVNNVACDLGSDQSVTFTGTYAPVNIGSNGDNTKLYIGSDNQIYYPNGTMTINSQRAYFQLIGLTAGDLTAGASAFVLNFGDGETTGISPSPTLPQGKGAWYTLDGRQLQGEPTQKGLYINNGRKVIIK